MKEAVVLPQWDRHDITSSRQLVGGEVGGYCDSLTLGVRRVLYPRVVFLLERNDLGFDESGQHRSAAWIFVECRRSGLPIDCQEPCL